MGRHSQGCRNCVRRHLKCGEEKPSCGRCLKAGLHCPGARDPKDLVFVFEKQGSRRSSSLATSIPQNAKVTSDQSPESSQQASLLTSPPLELDFSGFSQDIYLTFLLDRFFATNPHHGDHFANGVWMTAFLSDPDSYPLSALALKALAISFYGRQHHQHSIVAQSTRSYGMAISKLSPALADNTKLLEYDTLSAVTALYYYEYMTFTTRRGWLQHAKALSTLVELKGPESFQSFPARSILDAVREPLIGVAIAMRQKSFLEDDVWQLHGCYPLRIGQHLVALSNIFAKVPGIAQAALDSENNACQGQENVHELEDVRRHVNETQGALDDWYMVFTCELRHRVKILPPTNIICDPRARPAFFSSLFGFDDLICAKAFVDFWTISIMTLEWGHRTIHPNWQRGKDHEGWADIPQAKTFALNICRSIAYFLQPFHVESAPWYLSLPIRTAYLALPRTSPEAMWLSTVTEAVADKNEVEFSRNVLNNIPVRKRRVVDTKRESRPSALDGVGLGSPTQFGQSVTVQA